jgi:hypothetical protein
VMRLSEGTSETLLRESSGAGRCVLGSLEAGTGGRLSAVEQDGVKRF